MSCHKSSLAELTPKIGSNSFSTTFNALIEISKLCRKDPSAVADFMELGGVPALLKLIERPKLSDISLSILANCCLNEDVRGQVLKNNGVRSIVRVFSCIEKESIRNRACRALANIAMTSQGGKEVYKCSAIPQIVDLVTSSQQQDSKHTALRAIRILANTPRYREDLIRHKASVAVAKLLLTGDIQKAALQTLASLTQMCSTECALQLMEGDGIKCFEDILSCTDVLTLESALSLLINLSVVGDVRPTLGAMGAVRALVQQLGDYKVSRPSYGSLFSALCRYSQESVNRIRFRESDGLSLLVRILKDEERKELWPCTICALLQFRYDEASLDRLWDLGVGSALLLHIGKYTEEHVQKDHNARDTTKEKSHIVVTAEIIPVDGGAVIDDSSAAKQDECTDIEDDSSSECEEEVKATTGKVFCIHSPSYQEIQNARALQNAETYSVDSGYKSYQCSPNSPDYGFQASPRRVGSPVSAEYASWSPCSSPRCESPILVASPEPFRCFSPVCSEDEDTVESVSQSRNELTAVATNAPSSQDDAAEVVPRKSEATVPHSKEEANAKTSCPSDAGVTEKAVQQSNNAEVATDCRGASTAGLRRRSRSYSSSLENDQLTKRRNKPESKGLPDSTSSPPCKQRCRRRSSETQFVIPKDPKDAFFDAVLRIISVYSYLEAPKFDMAACGLFAGLVRYVFSVPQPTQRAKQVLFRLASSVYSFESIISSGDLMKVVHAIADNDHAACERCQHSRDLGESVLARLASVAESGFGSGVIARTLLVEEKNQQQSCCLAIPYVVRERTILRQLLFDCSGIDHLLDILEENIEAPDAFGLAVDSLHRLCLTVCPEACPSSTQTPTAESHCHLKTFSADVRFRLDDGTMLEGNRTELSCNNSYFSGMLAGHFIEKGQEVVNFPKASSESLNVVLHVLHGCDLEQCPSTRESSFRDSVLVDIGVLRLCDLLLLPKLQKCIEARVKRNLSVKTAVDVYDCVQELGMCDLKMFVLRYVLTCEMDRHQRRSCLRRLLCRPHIGHVLKDLLELVRQDASIVCT